MVKKILILTIAFYTVLSCGKFKDIDMVRVPYDGNEIRTDGYYYYHNTNYPNANLEKDLLTDILIFNRNGVCLGLVDFSYSNKIVLNDTLGYIEKKVISNNEYVHRNLNIPSGVGVFHVTGNNIKSEIWIVRSPTSYNYNIINDTTIYSHRDRATYRFKQYSPKPDSISVFIP